MKDGGGKEVRKVEISADPPLVDRSSTCCRPVDRRTEPRSKGEREERKGERKMGFLGLMLGMT